MLSKQPGKVITFYSYKGGTGRTMALANVAWILASNGHNVLTVDWDLEAPGLHRYFRPFLIDQNLTSSEGLIDFAWSVALDMVTPDDKSGRNPNPTRDFVALAQKFCEQLAIRLDIEFPSGGTIDFIPAGRQGVSYAERVSGFNWKNFYERLAGGAFFDAVRKEMQKEYDYVLIDSRTGVSDTSGICTIALPDELVVCFTPNVQSIEGAAAAAESVRGQRRALSPNAEPLAERKHLPVTGIKIWPVPSRITGEKERLDRAMSEMKRRFGAFLDHLSPDDVEPYWNSIPVLHSDFYGYEEVLATVADVHRRPGALVTSFEELTARITDHHVSRVVPLDESYRLEILRKSMSITGGEEVRRPAPIPSAAAVTSAENPVFEIGLTLDGGLESGPYMAGVMSFFLDAIESWKRAAAIGETDVPNHRVALRAIAGASAGTLVSANAVEALLASEDQRNEARKELESFWIDALDAGDLMPGHVQPDVLPSQTIFSGDALLARYASGRPAPTQAVGTASDMPLEVFLCFSNLDGIPYSLDGGLVSDHLDYMHFVSDDKVSPSGAIPLRGSLSDAEETWRLFRNVAIAGASLPPFLPPRTVSVTADRYLRRYSTKATTQDSSEARSDSAPVQLIPALDTSDGAISFRACDAGFLPLATLELVQGSLSGVDTAGARRGFATTSATVMIQPLPTLRSRGRFKLGDRLLSVPLGAMLLASFNQSRFRPTELALAGDEFTFNRFAIAPRRSTAALGRAAEPLACAGLGGVGGLLERAFRQHDFQLGRRNCQRFLRQIFVLPESNPIFANCTVASRDRFRMMSRTGAYLPLIPLTGEAAVEIQPPTWPRLSPNSVESKLKQLVERRSEMLLPALVQGKGIISRTIIQASWRLQGDGVRDWLVERCMIDLKLLGVLEGD
jgi:cellulose biosynthesis protein BcsQ